MPRLDAYDDQSLIYILGFFNAWWNANESKFYSQVDTTMCKLNEIGEKICFVHVSWRDDKNACEWSVDLNK